MVLAPLASPIPDKRGMLDSKHHATKSDHECRSLKHLTHNLFVSFKHSFSAMGSYSRFVSCAALLCTVLSVVHSVGGHGFPPQRAGARNSVMPQRRANCEPNVLDVSEDRVSWPSLVYSTSADGATDNRGCLQPKPSERFQ